MTTAAKRCRLCRAVIRDDGVRFVAFGAESYACAECTALIQQGAQLAKRGAVEATRVYLRSKFPNFFGVMQLYARMRADGEKS